MPWTTTEGKIERRAPAARHTTKEKERKGLSPLPRLVTLAFQTHEISVLHIDSTTSLSQIAYGYCRSSPIWMNEISSHSPSWNNQSTRTSTAGTAEWNKRKEVLPLNTSSFFLRSSPKSQLLNEPEGEESARDAPPDDAFRGSGKLQLKEPRTPRQRIPIHWKKKERRMPLWIYMSWVDVVTDSLKPLVWNHWGLVSEIVTKREERVIIFLLRKNWDSNV